LTLLEWSTVELGHHFPKVDWHPINNRISDQLALGYAPYHEAVMWREFYDHVAVDDYLSMEPHINASVATNGAWKHTFWRSQIGLFHYRQGIVPALQVCTPNLCQTSWILGGLLAANTRFLVFGMPPTVPTLHACLLLS
jgi:hypothetical protein